MRTVVPTILTLALLGASGPSMAQEKACPPPLPTNTAGSFKHKRSKLVVAHGSARHRGQDVLVAAGQPQRLAAKFAYGQADKDLKDEAVQVFVQKESPCGEWVLLGEAWTTRDGEKALKPHTMYS